jgi:hypothetical protein
VPEFPIKKSFKGKEPIFDEEKHLYLDSKTKTPYYNVTRWLSKFKPEFDFVGMSEMYAEKYNLEVEKVREMWNKKRDDSIIFGKKFHKVFEEYLTSSSIIEEDYKPVVEQFNCLNLINRKHNNFFEKRLYNPDLNIAGTADIISINKDTFDIYDFKTNKKLGFENSFKNDKWLKSPLDHLPNSEYFNYSLQLSLYAYLTEKMTGLKCNRLRIFWYNRQQPENYESLQGRWQIYTVPYLEEEIKACINELSQ